MTDRDKILDRIKKLLRMRRGGTAAEVETALALAAELARKHGINLGQIDPDEQPAEQPITHIDAVTSARLQWECKFSALIAHQFFNVNALIRFLGGTTYKGLGGRYGLRGTSQYCITFVGTAWDIQIAVYVYTFLIRAFRDAWRIRRGRARNRHAFMHGMYHGLCSKLDEQRKQQVSGEGLIFVGRALARRENYLQRFGKLGSQDTTPDADATAASLAGYMAGRDTEIRSGITNNGIAAPLLTS
jgi:hypothetical protein